MHHHISEEAYCDSVLPIQGKHIVEVCLPSFGWVQGLGLGVPCHVRQGYARDDGQQFCLMNDIPEQCKTFTSGYKYIKNYFVSDY